jgi:hypothetical protein
MLPGSAAISDARARKCLDRYTVDERWRFHGSARITAYFRNERQKAVGIAGFAARDWRKGVVSADQGKQAVDVSGTLIVFMTI